MQGEIERVMESIERLVGCDMSATSRLALVRGRCVHDGVIVRGGGEGARALWLGAQGTVAEVPWDPERPRPREIGRFRTTFDGRGARAGRELAPVYARFYLPIGLTSDARMLVYDGDRFVCWIGLLRADPARPFRAHELAKLNAAAPSVASALVALDRRRRASESGTPADLVFAPDGRLIAACDGGRTLVDRGGTEDLSSLVRRADRRAVDRAADRAVDRAGDRAVDRVIVAGRAVRVTRMDGPGGVRYLVHVGATETPRARATARLAPRQREVALLAARGATVDEIATHLEVGRETVRQHLRRSYARLGVATRLELARALDE